MSKNLPSWSGAFVANGSTFMHEIHLDPLTNAQQVMTGYSRNRHYPEAHDKAYVAKSVLHRILPKYFDAMLFVDVFRKLDRTKEHFLPKNRVHVARIYRTEVHLFNRCQIFDEALGQWINLVLDRLAVGDSTADLKPVWERGNSYEKILDAYLINRRFTRLDDLVSFCRSQIAEGRERGILENFYHSYSAKYFKTAK